MQQSMQLAILVINARCVYCGYPHRGTVRIPAGAEFPVIVGTAPCDIGFRQSTRLFDYDEIINN
jgi:hypothetical protein